MSGRAYWQEVSGDMRPNDGERVLVRQRPDGAQRLVIFRASPAPRWETPDGSHVYEFHHFTQWRSTAEPFGIR